MDGIYLDDYLQYIGDKAYDDVSALYGKQGLEGIRERYTENFINDGGNVTSFIQEDVLSIEVEFCPAYEYMLKSDNPYDRPELYYCDCCTKLNKRVLYNAGYSLEIDRCNKNGKCGGVVPSLTDGVPPEWYAGNILKIIPETGNTRELELHAVRIGCCVIVTLSGEVFVEFGLKIKELSHCDNTILFGLANQSIGYIPTVQAFKNGGYETTTCEFSILVPEAGEMIVEKLLEMIGEVYR